MIWMGVIKAKEIGVQLGGAPFRLPIVLRPHEEPPPRTFLGGIRKGKDGNRPPLTAEQSATAFVGIRLDTMLSNGADDIALKMQRHLPGSLWGQTPVGQRGQTPSSGVFGVCPPGV